MKRASVLRRHYFVPSTGFVGFSSGTKGCKFSLDNRIHFQTMPPLRRLSKRIKHVIAADATKFEARTSG